MPTLNEVKFRIGLALLTAKDAPLREIAVPGIILGLLSHWLVFIRGEHLKAAPQYFLVSLTTPCAIAITLVRFLRFSGRRALAATAVGWISYFTALYASMMVYRSMFHPLRHFPGPFWAKFSQFWGVLKTAPKTDNFRHLDRLHAQYGEYVRVGPNLLSVSDPDLVEPIHNTHTKFTKAEWYDAGHPTTSLHQMRDRAEHDKRRRAGWDKAFTTKSLRAYDSRVVKYADLLIGQLRKRSGQVVNATDWFLWYGFDVMGDLAFGRSFDNLAKARSHLYIEIMHAAGASGGSLTSVPWAIQLSTLVPSALNPLAKLSIFAEKAMRDRRSGTAPAEPDVMSHLLDAGAFYPSPRRNDLLLVGDARLLIVAGSDTTASTLVYAFYNLAANPGFAEQVRAELAEHGIHGDEDVSVTALQNLPFMNAVINETLRLHPPVPGGVYRHTPKEGVVVNGHKLPGGVKIVGPHHTIQRSPKAFVEPLKFIPERWTTRPELVLNKNAWFPFSIGKFSCIGKQLALNELRTVISKVLLNFDVRLAPGETGRDLLEESKDMFTLINGKLELVFTERVRAVQAAVEEAATEFVDAEEGDVKVSTSAAAA
ncbi:cytochrome P450 [Microdochium trichocladiopsis]|uniref:Cytochrome P450 n=1 Tax=Microdochium trichocladiopsis TaxID=1682393 RepID=A0A9P9BIJ6_9PEZI|nr:cytochrome P450 [Microdochium trichocladiopsis]KAH7014463.1 cytochrome P450 [Microdochium trichocladiopsis]